MPARHSGWGTGVVSTFFFLAYKHCLEFFAMSRNCFYKSWEKNLVK